MTLDTFLKKLEQTPRDWRVSGDLIRRGRHSTCPVCALTRELGIQWALAAARIGLRQHTAKRIARAADKHPQYEPALRRKLLRACGLPPER